MLNMECTQEIVDSIHGSILYSGIEREIIGNSFFNRLHKVHQGSLVFMTYPSNKVMRFEHSIGTMHLAGQFLFKSVCNTSEKDLQIFFNEINQEIIKWNRHHDPNEVHYIHRSVLTHYKDEGILEVPIPNNLLYHQNFPENLSSKNKFSYYVVYQSIRLAGMLHDIGHLPYSHILEHALDLLYHKVNNIPLDEKKESHQYFIDTLSKYCTSDDFEIHEELGKRFVDKIFQSIVYDFPPRSENPSLYFLAVVFYFTRKILNAKNGENTIFGDLHRIVSGTIDCDRMDYCCRDVYCSGISKELPNYSRIFNTLHIVYKNIEEPFAINKATNPLKNRLKRKQQCCFTVSAKAIGQIENLLQRRWDIYSTINFHHRVHKHELMLENIIAELGLQEMESGVLPAELKDVLPLQVSSIWQLISQMDDSSPIDYVALQLDDSWLDTLLKHKYFDKYSNSFFSISSHAEDPNWHRLDELISTQKHYYSLLKRSDSFRRFDDLLYKILSEKTPDSISSCIDFSEKTEYSKILNDGEFLFNYIVRTIAPSKELRAKFFTELDSNLRKHIKDNPKLQITDTLLSDCTFSPGISKSDPLYIISFGSELKPFFHYTSLSEQLFNKRKLLPSFHLYYLPAYDSENNKYYTPNNNDLLQLLADCTVEQLSKWDTNA